MSTYGFDRVIVSANESWLYIDFWPLVAYAYRTIFPGVKVELAFLSERLETDPFVAQLRTHGDVTLVCPVRGVPQAAQAKLARYYAAAMVGDANEVVMVDDIDEIPISREWYVGKLTQRKPDTMLLIGAELFGDGKGQAPASMMTAERRVWLQLFGRGDTQPFSEWLEKLLRTAPPHADYQSRANHEEDPTNTTNQRALGEPAFSDEVLIDVLREETEIPVTHVRRGYVTGVHTVDRSQWQGFSFHRLEEGAYLAAHVGRPYRDYKEGIDAIIDYVRRRYDGHGLPPLLERRPQIDPDMVLDDHQRGVLTDLFAHSGLYAGIIQWRKDPVLTNYLSRYFLVIVIENDRSLVNLYPAHYVCVPDGDPDQIDLAIRHPRAMRRGISREIFE